MKDFFELKPVTDLRLMGYSDLTTQLLELRRFQFQLRLAKSSGELKQTHQIKNLRRYIAQIKTIMQEKKVGQ
jgi:large subunit ribosomal protein L29